jgi:hypothetical protein
VLGVFHSFEELEVADTLHLELVVLDNWELVVVGTLESWGFLDT